MFLIAKEPPDVVTAERLIIKAILNHKANAKALIGIAEADTKIDDQVRTIKRKAVGSPLDS